MMKLRAFSTLFLCLQLSTLLASHLIKGKVISNETNEPIAGATVILKSSNFNTTTNKQGDFLIPNISEGEHELIILSEDYQSTTEVVNVNKGQVDLIIKLIAFEISLSELVVAGDHNQGFGLARLNSVEGTAIYAGRKTEVILLENKVGNIASNNARQLYAQVAGLNIYESADAGLQLNVGGRGLDPNRSANFNTRQNGYDISADVLGYPESYYTPPAEALNEIQVVRGAAALQYGTQFGGLINFKFKTPHEKKKISVVSRQTLGSFNLFSSFNSFSGTVGKFSYYSYINYKSGDGFRPNSAFDALNAYASLNYQLTKKTKLTLESTYMNYLAQQAGGLTDDQFNSNINFSNRSRNWFEVNWKLMAFKLNHNFSPKSTLNLTVFGLSASRDAVGFRGSTTNLNSNPITDIDEQDPEGNFISPRDLMKGKFRNWGFEARYLKRYKIGANNAVFLIGGKHYQANNQAQQGPGTTGEDANFSFTNDRFPDYANQSDFKYPNLNHALFTEHVFFISDKMTITPGARFEMIKTESEGTYSQVVFDNAGNPISNLTLTDNRTLERSFLLLGIGLSYKPNNSLETYGNISQNYRSITFSDIRVVNPTFIIDPNIQDEKGYTADVGVRGLWQKTISYDFSIFSLYYDNRIGVVLDERANRVRKNIGTAFIYGLESFIDWNITKTFFTADGPYQLNWFVNNAFTSSEYIASDENNVVGKKVEFIPTINMKTGIVQRYKKMKCSIQYTLLTEQYTDVENSSVPETGDARNGIIGEIPAYDIVDLSFAYNYKKWTVEAGVNNLLNNTYFTRRATGYPGPGIIPSDPRSFYFTLGITL